MGCCNSKGGESTANRIARWRSTGIVALRDSKLKIVPNEIFDLEKSVRTLDVTHNKIVDIPVAIFKLTNMQRLLLLLNVSNNKLKSLPESIGSCFSLEELQANGNLIDDLPSSICNLVYLKSLCLDNNNVYQIPHNLLKDCKALQNISLHDNPISMDQFQQMEGFREFEARRKKKFDKQIDSNVMISSKGLDEGVDL
uniref:Plant intracellular Ras-group-related LRR protein 7 n=1 Tax=Nelumbo nucifera TaxID=4432 RepID=A0A822YG69_NELNU|nr:TPA_asm: hypothetical protein HUJ06_010273 [Nelumbo nucifera]